ncbi:mechanosensitive ion channel family protein [Aureicoccus marinus]|uniref:Mechanosensitive ion channel protein n=1 Tax=Aureicoccus marinus TaxID=754435 RepID=A0A2S7T7B1_9FLAO|nr:mechanosensitive ion channel domain-containing protein [Aureicoccus marinus]PQJ15813.1 mechanosensitive ion channel protein [Aureicoccus marinus]
MDKLENYRKHIDLAIEWLWNLVPNLVLAFLILVFGLWIIKFINKAVAHFFDKKDYDITLERFIQSFIHYTLRILLFVLVITQLGVKTSSLIAMLGAAGLAIGLALQGSLANFAGGVLLLVFKPFKVGDFISAQGIDGTVKEISIFQTKLNTFGNQVAIIPNGQLSNGSLINYNAENMRRDNFTVGIGYGSDIKKAKAILLDICQSHEDIMKDPAPEVYVSELGDSSVNLSLRFWASNENFWPAHFYVIEQTKERFDQAQIEIPFPQQVIHRTETN